MHSGTRILAVLSGTLALAIVILISEQTIKSHSASEGIVREDGQLLGGDFAAFYLGGRLFQEDLSRLYDLEYQVEYRTEWLGPEADSFEGELPFVYPPLVAALVSPFTNLPFRQAFWGWVVFGVAVSLSSLVLLSRASGAGRVLPTGLLLLLSLGFVPFSLNSTIGGQIPWLGITTLALVSTALLKERDVLAGLAMSLSYYKPPVFLLMLIAMCFGRGRRFVVGFGIGAILLMGSTLIIVGPDGLIRYLGMASGYTYGQDVVGGAGLPESYGMGLVGLIFTLSSSMKTTLLFLAFPFVGLTWVSARLVRTGQAEDLLLGLMLASVGTGALSLQFGSYDLALLLVPMVLGIAWHGGERNLRRLLVLLPLGGFYLEFAFRNLPIGQRVFNASSLLFLLSLSLMAWLGWHRIRDTGSRDQDDAPAPTSG